MNLENRYLLVQNPLIYKGRDHRNHHVEHRLLTLNSFYGYKKYRGKAIPTKYTLDTIGHNGVVEINTRLQEFERFQDQIFGKSRGYNLYQLASKTHGGQPMFVDAENPHIAFNCIRLWEFLEKHSPGYIKQLKSGMRCIRRVLEKNFPEPEKLLDQLGGHEPDREFIYKQDHYVLNRMQNAMKFYRADIERTLFNNDIKIQ